MQLWIITIMLAALSGCTLISAISVRIVSGSTTNTLSIASNSACTTLASQNATISCHFTLLDESAPSTQMLADWDAMLLSTNDDLVIAMSFLYATTVTTLAPKYPGRTFAIYDTGVFPPIANVLGLTFAEDQSGFLAGALAAMFTTSKKVGVLGAFPIPPIKRFANGFMQGALALCPACEVHRVYEPSFASAALGQQGAAELLGKGADVIFGAGGQMGSAGILAAAQQNTYVIGVDVDETQTTFLGQVSGPYLLASAIKNTGVSITAAIRAVQGGARGGYNALLDSSLNGVSLSSPLVSNSVKNFAASVQVSLKTSGSPCATSSFASRSDILSLISSSLQRKQTVTQVTADTGDLTSLTRPANKTWYDMSPWGVRSQMLPNMQGHAAVHIGNSQVLVYGGQSPFGAFPTTVMMLDYDPFEWKPVVDGGSGTVPAGRMFHAMGYDDAGNAMYVFGGQGAAGIFDDCWKYSVATATWALLPAFGASIPSGRTNMAHATVGRALYVYGGVTASGKVLDDLWALNMADGSWAVVTPVVSATSESAQRTMHRPPGLQHATLVAVNGTNLVLYGGTDDLGIQRSDLYVFSPADLTWTLQSPSTLGSGPPPPVERMRGISVDSRRVIFTGGLGANGALNSTWVWKMDEDAWAANAYGSLPGTLHSHALVAFNQSANANACAWTIPGLPICTPSTNFTLVAISGATNNPGGGVVVSFANQDPLPPPVGVLDPGAKWAVTVLNGLGLVSAVLLFAFVAKHRTHRVIKASNPRFSALILIGAALAHVGIISSTWQNDARYSYVLTSFLVGAGYSLIFSSLVVKTFVLYLIFAERRMTSVKHKKNMYWGFIAGMLGLQCVLSALWFAFDKNPTVSLIVGRTVWTIRSIDGNWVVLCSLPVVLLTLAGVFLSFKTRHVQSAFNESQYIGLATYAIAMALLVVGPVILLLQVPMVQYTIAALLVTLTTLAVQAIFFGHKVIAVVNPDANIETVTTTESATGGEGTDASDHTTTRLRCKACRQVIQHTTSMGGHTSFTSTLRRQKRGNMALSMVVTSVSVPAFPPSPPSPQLAGVLLAAGPVSPPPRLT